MARVTRAWGGALLLTIALLVLNWPRVWLHQAAREGIFSFENGVAWFQARLWRPAVRLWRASAVERRNALLEAEVERLRLEAALLETVAQENAALRRPFALPARSPGSLLPAWVLSAGGTTGWWRQIRINRGRAVGFVTVMHPAAIAKQLKHGLLTTAAARAGLEVKRYRV